MNIIAEQDEVLSVIISSIQSSGSVLWLREDSHDRLVKNMKIMYTEESTPILLVTKEDFYMKLMAKYSNPSI